MALGRLCGKIAIVTASTHGIGFATGEKLGKEGAKVIVSSRKQTNVDAAVKRLCESNVDATGLVCHVSKSEDRKKLFETARSLGGLDILVSNAGINPAIGEVLSCSEEVWDKIFDVNVKSSFLLAKESLSLLKKSKAGRIIFISSIAGFQPFSLLGAYSVSKTALLGLTKAAALQLAVDDITVNCVAPGIIHTKFSEVLTNPSNAETSALRDIPLNR